VSNSGIWLGLDPVAVEVEFEEVSCSLSWIVWRLFGLVHILRGFVAVSWRQMDVFESVSGV
jgi:hypothetical protein